MAKQIKCMCTKMHVAKIRIICETTKEIKRKTSFPFVFRSLNRTSDFVESTLARKSSKNFLAFCSLIRTFAADL